MLLNSLLSLKAQTYLNTESSSVSPAVQLFPPLLRSMFSLWCGQSSWGQESTPCVCGQVVFASSWGSSSSAPPSPSCPLPFSSSFYVFPSFCAKAMFFTKEPTSHWVHIFPDGKRAEAPRAVNISSLEGRQQSLCVNLQMIELGLCAFCSFSSVGLDLTHSRN